MSFELFLQSFAQGEPAGISAQAIRSAFGATLSELEEDYWQVNYTPDQSSDLFLTPLPAHPDRIHTVSIYRPCADARLCESIWRLLEAPGSCLHFPGGGTPLTRDPAMSEAMPAELLAALGTPIVIDSPAALARVIQVE